MSRKRHLRSKLHSRLRSIPPKPRTSEAGLQALGKFAVELHDRCLIFGGILKQESKGFCCDDVAGPEFFLRTEDVALIRDGESKRILWPKST